MIVLDTQAWYWWASKNRRLSKAARDSIDQADAIGVSSASALELARLARAGLIEFDDVNAWILAGLRFDPRLREIPIDSSIAMRAVDLMKRGFHKDPMDQVIFATAELSAATLVTSDRKIREFAPSQTLW